MQYVNVFGTSWQGQFAANEWLSEL